MQYMCYILGTPYEITDQTECNSRSKLIDNSGLAELYAKKLIVNFEDVGEPNNYENEQEYYKKVLRHEMIHAFFHESGLSDYCKDEKLVDFLAIQLDKMWEIMNPETLEGYINGLGYKWIKDE